MPPRKRKRKSPPTKRSPTCSDRKPHGPKLSAAQEARIWLLHVKGWTQARIALDIKRDQSTVSDALKRMQARAFVEISDDILNEKFLQTVQLKYLTAQACDGWERSQQDAETTHTRTKTVETTEATPKTVGLKTKTTDPKTAGVTTTTTNHTLKGQAGAPEMLAQARGALSDIRDIWGIEVQATPAAATATEPADEVESILAELLERKTHPPCPPSPPPAKPPRKRRLATPPTKRKTGST